MKILSISVIFSIYILLNAIIFFGLVSISFEIDTVLGEIENSTDNNDSKPTNDTKQQQVIEGQCKSPCPPNADMCIEMCA
jgi:hypothetical protein